MRSPSTALQRPPVRAEVSPGVWLDGRLALWLEAERLLVIADLHWGYAASHRVRGNLLPWWGDDQLEEQLQAVIATYAPAEMIWLGDIVHAAEGGARADAFVRASPVPITLLAGNHDRRWRSAGAKSAVRGNFFFHHGDVVAEVPANCVEIVGHHHPAVSCWDGAGGSVKLPALVASARRLILPAFSPWSAGTPWTSCAGAEETLWAIAPGRIFPLPRSARAPSS